MQYLPPGVPVSLERAQSVVAYFMSQRQQHGYGPWAVIEQASGALIGQCGLNFLPELGEVEVLYALAKPHWGRGLATEGAHAAARYGFEELGLREIVALAAVDNLASQRVMDKLGMKYRRTLKLWKMRLKLYSVRREHFTTGDAPYLVRQESPRMARIKDKKWAQFADRGEG